MQVVTLVKHVILAAVLVAMTGCSSMYYSMADKMGRSKRDIMVSRVESVKKDQEKATENFQTTLEKFTEIVNVQGGDLEKKYNTLKSEYDDCKSRADAVTNRIKSVEDVSDALFKEWEGELDQYSNPDLRRASERQLIDTRKKYDTFVTVLHRAESRMQPVLAAFNDQVLFMKHNLNAQAIASIQGEVDSMEGDVQALIVEMNSAIAEANVFLEQMRSK